MDLDEVKNLKSRTESNILDLIKEFTSITGLDVKSLDLNSLTKYSCKNEGDTYYIDIKMTINL